MSVLAVKFKVINAHSGTKILGPPVYDKEGNRVGQLICELVDVASYNLTPEYTVAEDAREGNRETGVSVGESEQVPSGEGKVR